MPETRFTEFPALSVDPRVWISRSASETDIWLFLCPRRNFGRHIKIAPSVRPSVSYKSCLSDSSEATEANLMKHHRKIKHNENVCRAHDFGSYAQGQGRNHVRGQDRVSTITQK